jgi:hypothetical protein
LATSLCLANGAVVPPQSSNAVGGCNVTGPLILISFTGHQEDGKGLTCPFYNRPWASMRKVGQKPTCTEEEFLSLPAEEFSLQLRRCQQTIVYSPIFRCCVVSPSALYFSLSAAIGYSSSIKLVSLQAPYQFYVTNCSSVFLGRLLAPPDQPSWRTRCTTTPNAPQFLTGRKNR